MTTLPEKLLHLANLEDSYIALMKGRSDDSTIQVGYKHEYDNLRPDNFTLDCDYHYKTISLCLQQILLNLEVEDLEEKQLQKQELKEWIVRYPLSLGILNWCDYCKDDEIHEASQRFPFLLREIIGNKKFRLLPFLIEAGMDYFEADLRGGLLQKLSCFSPYVCMYEGNNEFFPNDLVYPGMTVLDAIVSFNYDNSMALYVLSTLENMGILQKNDVQEQNLLSKTLFIGSSSSEIGEVEKKCQERFDFLVEMDPDALFGEVDEGDKDAFNIRYDYDDAFYDMYGDWNPALMVLFAIYFTHEFQIALQATLKIFPRDLGLLLLQAKYNSKHPSWNERAVLLSFVNKCSGIDDSWEVIESSFRNMTNRHALFSIDQEKGIYPFMQVAESLAVCCDDGDIKLTLLYYLLREDLSWLKSL